MLRLARPTHLDRDWPTDTAGAVTYPSTMAEEWATNPFLRWDAEAVIEAARAHGATSDTPAEVFAAIRRWKDTA